MYYNGLMKKSPTKNKDQESAFLLKLIKIFAVAIIAAIALRFIPLPNLEFKHLGKIKVGSQVLVIEYAEGNEKIAKGLGGRNELAKDHGMFFVFPADGVHYFWMKGMNFPLDIIFLSSDYKIIDILYNAPPCTETECPPFTPQEKFRYGLEVNAGWSRENNLKIGDQFEIVK